MSVGRSIGRTLLFVLLLVTGVYLVIVVMACMSQSRMMYQPTREIEQTPSDAGMQFEEVTFTAADGTQLHGWFVPVEDPRAVVLWFHGNGGNIGHRIETLGIFHQLGVSAFIFDYRGYGQSEGTPDEKGTYLDADAAWAYLTEQRGVRADQIVLFGRSLGGVFAARRAEASDVAGVIVESAFTSVPDLGADMYPLLPTRWLSRFRYPTGDHLAGARCPVLVMHSPDDEIIPYKHGRRLFELAPGPKMFVEMTGGHNDGFALSGQAYSQAIDEFLRDLIGR